MQKKELNESFCASVTIKNGEAGSEEVVDERGRVEASGVFLLLYYGLRGCGRVWYNYI